MNHRGSCYGLKKRNVNSIEMKLIYARGGGKEKSGLLLIYKINIQKSFDRPRETETKARTKI